MNPMTSPNYVCKLQQAKAPHYPPVINNLITLQTEPDSLSRIRAFFFESQGPFVMTSRELWPQS